MPVKIFLCYAREDEALLKKLKAHLKPLQLQGLIDFWDDRNIVAGADWERDISKQLNSAQIILLLVSPAFMDSDYCYSNEMKRAMKRHEQGEAYVIPVILRPVSWQGAPFSKLQALPKDAIPITSPHWYTLDEAFFNVAESLRKTVETLFNQKVKAEVIWSTEGEQRQLEGRVPNTNKNPVYRCPIILLLDTSRSMSGFPIESLNEGLEIFQTKMNNHPVAQWHAEIAIVTFGNGRVQNIQDFVIASKFQAPLLIAGGVTQMDKGISYAIDLLNDRINQYKAVDIVFTRPWLFVMANDVYSDRRSLANYEAVAKRVKSGESNHTFAFFMVALRSSILPILNNITVRKPLKVSDFNYNNLFTWLAECMGRVSTASIGTRVALPSPEEWADLSSS